jgi:hypothetical protein
MEAAESSETIAPICLMTQRDPAKVKVKSTPEQAMKAQRRSRGTALLVP